ncbi:MAG: cell division protein FtsB [Gammaproteobacteria bacterium]|nr:cell division protein FtsB [Gammaproteobacteria bacterium]
MTNPATLILLSALLSLQFALWFGDKNVVDLHHLGNAVSRTVEHNKLLNQRNQKLLAEVIDLKQGGETLETLARSELGLIKADETFYQIIDTAGRR